MNEATPTHRLYYCETCNKYIEVSFAPGPTDSTMVMRVTVPAECSDEKICHMLTQSKAHDIIGLEVENITDLGYADGE